MSYFLVFSKDISSVMNSFYSSVNRQTIVTVVLFSDDFSGLHLQMYE